MPVYFQTVFGASPSRSGVQLLPTTIIIVPFGVTAGVLISKTGLYPPLRWVDMGLASIGAGLLSSLTIKSNKASWICFQLIMASGVSIVAASTLPPTLAALPESNVATASGMYPFLRSFSYICGVTAPPIVLDGQIQKYAQRIGNADVQAQSANKAGGIWAGVKEMVIGVYVDALQTVSQVSVAFACIGFLRDFTERHLELRQELDTVYVYGLDEGSKDKTNGDSEAGGHDMVPLATLKQAQQEI